MIPNIDLELELENEKVYVIVHYFPEVVGPLDTEPSRISIVSAFRSGEDDPMSDDEIQKIREDYGSDLHEMADDWFNEESANWDGDDDYPDDLEYWPEPLNEWEY